MRAHFSQIKLVTLCVSLLTLLALALVGCGQYVCNVAYAAPTRTALTVDNGVVYGLGDKLSAMRSSDGKVLWQDSIWPSFVMSARRRLARSAACASRR